MLKARQNGGLVIVRSDGHQVARYNAVVLARDWLRMGDVKFAAHYGFTWQPTAYARTEAARQLETR